MDIIFYLNTVFFSGLVLVGAFVVPLIFLFLILWDIPLPKVGKNILAVVLFLPLLMWWMMCIPKPDNPNYPATRIWNSVTMGYDEYQKEYYKQEKLDKVHMIDIGPEIHRFKLITWNPPKHFYVTLQNVNTKYIHEYTYVSKHCNSASALVAGEEYNIQMMRYRWSNSPTEYLKFIDLYKTFCN